MEFRFRSIFVSKLFPLAISRGVNAGSTSLFAFVKVGEHEGVGECSPGTGDDGLPARAMEQMQALAKEISEPIPHVVWQKGAAMGMENAALAAIDVALWDLLAKQANLPLYRLLVLQKPLAVTSVTNGINPPDLIRERVPEMLKLWKARALKIKLGSPQGIDHDKESYIAARESAEPFRVPLRVDANGGWNQKDAIHMVDWLSERGCDYVEQPMVRGGEDEMHEVFKHRKLPIFLDESIHHAKDVVEFADRCDGINLKLMKTGGITEALRLVATARACGKMTMIGCMSDSSVGIAAGAAIGSLFDYIDLDSHLNLNPDPAEGLKFVAGVVLPSDAAGHGATVVE